jgi:transcription initiation factor TFIIIB Brf1 subunit/transcription initiation factor TFIIB
VRASAYTVWQDKLLADKVAEETVKIINRAYARKFRFFNGKTSRCLVGGLFYLLGFKYESTKRQRELADKLGTSDVTIRASYRDWLEEFPDMFLDGIGKLAMDKDLHTTC